MTAIASHVTAFFQQRLTLERRASANTCEDGQWTPDMVMGDRVIVQVEADIGRFADGDRDVLEQRRRVVGQWQQASRFFGKHLAYCAVRFIGTTPVGGRTVAPGLGLGIEIIEICEAAASEEAIADVADGALDAHPSHCRAQPPRGAAHSDNARRSPAGSDGTGSHRHAGPAPRS